MDSTAGEPETWARVRNATLFLQDLSCFVASPYEYASAPTSDPQGPKKPRLRQMPRFGGMTVQRLKWTMALVLTFLALNASTQVRAQPTVDVLLDMDAPPISAELDAYITSLGRMPLSPIVGFNGTDIGYGAGDGSDEDVPFSFSFAPFMSVSSATLTLDVTPQGTLNYNDLILLADEPSVCCSGEPGFLPYGTFEFADVYVLGERVTVVLDLMGLKDSSGVPTWDLSSFLLDGTFDVLYIDDSLVHSARLQITGELEGTIPTEEDGWGAIKALYHD